jgi:16S rRNA (uracil1498-N3)-methyltransferase
MLRRFHVPVLTPGDLPLDSVQAHHARDVLRLADGVEVNLFDDAGATARGILLHRDNGAVVVRVAGIDAPLSASRLEWIVAAAVPKGDRADWMVEKLSELGASAFIPLAAERSVVLPEGKGKRERWTRIAVESAKQSRRTGVMRIEPLTPPATVVASAQSGTVEGTSGWFFTTELPGIGVATAIESARDAKSLTLFIGPEGGWTQNELAMFPRSGMLAVRLGENILRIETAAVAAAAVVATMLG